MQCIRSGGYGNQAGADPNLPSNTQLKIHPPFTAAAAAIPSKGASGPGVLRQGQLAHAAQPAGGVRAARRQRRPRHVLRRELRAGRSSGDGAPPLHQRGVFFAGVGRALLFCLEFGKPPPPLSPSARCVNALLITPPPRPPTEHPNTRAPSRSTPTSRRATSSSRPRPPTTAAATSPRWRTLGCPCSCQRAHRTCRGRSRGRWWVVGSGSVGWVRLGWCSRWLGGWVGWLVVWVGGGWVASSVADSHQSTPLAPSTRPTWPPR
jgi:hypothetical protein